MDIVPSNQLSLVDIFSDCQDIYESDKPAFLSLPQSHIDLDEFIPESFLCINGKIPQIPFERLPMGTLIY